MNERSSWMKCQWNAGRLIVTDYVGRARMVQVTPVDGVRIIDRYIRNVWVYGRSQQKYPGRVERECRS